MLVVACGLAAIYAGRRDRSRDALAELDRLSLPELERRIADAPASVEVWGVYGQRLYDAKQFDRAALAFGRVIELQPYNRPARFQRGLSLAGAGDTEGVFAYLQETLYTEPKLVVELMDRPELRPFMGDAKFAQLQKDARSQAMD